VCNFYVCIIIYFFIYIFLCVYGYIFYYLYLFMCVSHVQKECSAATRRKAWRMKLKISLPFVFFVDPDHKPFGVFDRNEKRKRDDVF
jgi:hypothetical protein